jgi:glutathione synthase
MQHIFIIDPLEKLVVKKDSTLLLAHTLSARTSNDEVLVSFEKDWFFESGEGKKEVRCYRFDSELVDGFHLQKFETTKEEMVELNSSVLVHMRKDPPFDRTYLHMCWILQEVRKTGAKVINDPSQLLMINEKLIAYTDPDTIPTLISRDANVGVDYAKKLQAQGHESVIIKPLDLYQGIGVQKVTIDSELAETLEKAIEDYQGVYVMQPFVKKVEEGEIRSVFFANEHIGSIIKVPPKGSFLANIAQGAKYESIELKPEVMKACLEYSKDLMAKGVPFSAFDILDDKISEINITCPGLLVEVANAHDTNVCEQICDLIQKHYS